MYYGGLYVNDYRLSRLRDGLTDSLLTVFRDDMYRSREEIIADYRPSAVLEPDEAAEAIVVHEYSARGADVVERLEALGCNLEHAMRWLDDVLSHEHKQNLEHSHDLQLEAIRPSIIASLRRTEGYSANHWLKDVEQLGLPNDSDVYADSQERTRSWLFSLLDYWDERYALRLILAALPEARVTLDITDLVSIEEVVDPEGLCESAMESLRIVGSIYAPTVVLTEGRTDASILSESLQILHPHLTDVIKFMDFERRPEGGAGPLVGLVRAFAAAGISNRVVAIFDNDSAAAEALTSLDIRALPPNIRVRQYPSIELGRSYPTLGPPRSATEEVEIVQAEVNGVAGSIELYLGTDVLCTTDGSLTPIQWRNYSVKLRRYHGEIASKGRLQEKFFQKAALATQDSGVIQYQDWSGLTAILREIREAIADIATLDSLEYTPRL